MWEEHDGDDDKKLSLYFCGSADDYCILMNYVVVFYHEAYFKVVRECTQFSAVGMSKIGIADSEINDHASHIYICKQCGSVAFQLIAG